MNALLCAVNSKYVHSSLAVWYLAAGVKEYAPEVSIKVIEATINEEIERIYQKILENNFDIIGFSTYIWNVDYVLKIAMHIKEKTNAKIVLGGPEVSYNSSEILKKYCFIDYVIKGEGERAFAMLCRNDNVEEIDNLCYRNGKTIVTNKISTLRYDPPTPYTQEYFEALNGRIAYIETSRGCPYKCAFCLSGSCEGVRFFNIDTAKENIVKLANSGVQTVKFIDRTFNADRKRAIEIFSFIIDNYGKKVPPSVCFHFEMEGELIDDATVKVLEKAPIGLFQFEIGIQSFNSKTLDSINRKCNIDKLCEKIKRIIDLGNIHVHTDLIIGLPYEDMASFEKSFNAAYELNAQMLQIGFLKLLHGAGLEMNKDNYGLVCSERPPYEILANPWLSFEDIERLHLLEDVFEKAYNSGKLERTCKYLVSLVESPFQMYLKLGELWNKAKKSNSLDEFTKFLFDASVEIFGADREVLRDKMALDRLSTNKNGSLPEFLKIHSSLIKQTLVELDKDPLTRRKKGVKRSATVLAKEPKFVYVDYVNQNKVKKQFEIHEKIIKKDEN